jgi:glutamine amidotransferase-like uncharacterized protein
MNTMKTTSFILLAALAANAQSNITSKAASAAQPTPEPAIRMAVYGDKGAPGHFHFPALLKNVPDIQVEVINGQQIREGILDKFDLILLPGGSGKGQGDSMGPEGVAKLKEFVASGKGYIGICAGAYVPMQQGFMNAKTKDPRWRRGKAMLDIEFSEAGLKIFGEKYKGIQTIKYANGPIMDVNISTNLPPVEVLAWFRTEVAEQGTPKGIQVNSPAIVLTTYGKGKMFVVSPHPEQTPDLRGLVEAMVRFVVKKDKE